MNYPCLVRKKDCKTPVKVYLRPEGLTNGGEPKKAVEIEGMCNYQDSAKTVLTAQKQLIQLSGIALFPGDIAPDLPTLSGGTVIVNGAERDIVQGRKARNPDGTVNYSELDVI